MMIDWLKPNEKPGLQLSGVSLSKTTMRIGAPEAMALGTPAWVRCGLDDETQTLVIAPGDSESGVSLRRYSAGVSYQIGSRIVRRAVMERFGWQVGDELECVVRGKTLEVKRVEREAANPRRGQLLRAVGGDSAAGSAYGEGA